MARRGFTLLEVLLATAILGIILMTVYGVVARTLQSKNRAEARSELYAAGREAILRMADEIEGALPPNGNLGMTTTLETPYFHGVAGEGRVPNDAILFDTVIRRQFSASQSQGGRATVIYQLDPMEGRPNLFYLRREEQLRSLPPDTSDAANGDPNAPPSSDASSTEQADAETAPAGVTARYILDHVAGMKLRYYDPETGQFEDSWDTDAFLAEGKVPTLPAAVQIVLFLADDEGNIHDFSTTVDLPLANLQPTPSR
jgi:prepilin-type N-terminal cleavage/methylation domain-containing protein